MESELQLYHGYKVAWRKIKRKIWNISISESRVFDGVIGDSMKALNDNIVAGTVKVSLACSWGIITE